MKIGDVVVITSIVTHSDPDDDDVRHLEYNHDFAGKKGVIIGETFTQNQIQFQYGFRKSNGFEGEQNSGKFIKGTGRVHCWIVAVLPFRWRDRKYSTSIVRINKEFLL